MFCVANQPMFHKNDFSDSLSDVNLTPTTQNIQREPYLQKCHVGLPKLERLQLSKSKTNFSLLQRHNFSRPTHMLKNVAIFIPHILLKYIFISHSDSEQVRDSCKNMADAEVSFGTCVFIKNHEIPIKITK